MEDLATRLNGQMLKAGYDVSDLAEEADLTRAAVERYVSGEETPSLEALVALAGALSVGLDWLVLGQEPPPPEYAELKRILERVVPQQEEGGDGGLSTEEQQILGLIKDPICRSICNLMVKVHDDRRQANRQHLHTLAQFLEDLVYEGDELP